MMKTKEEILRESIKKHDSNGYCYCKFEGEEEGIEVSNTDSILKEVFEYYKKFN